MKQVRFYANFLSRYAKRSTSSPDYFVIEDCDRRPSPNFVISRTREGEVLSVYSDDVWDLRPYLLSSGSGKVYFSSVVEKNMSFIKWLTFLLIYVFDNGISTSLSVNTIQNYMKIVRRLDEFSAESDASLIEVLTNEKLFKRFVSSISDVANLVRLYSLLTMIQSLPPSIVNCKVSNASKKLVLERKKSIADNSRQTPVIPPRIMSTLIYQLESFISKVHLVKDRVFDFVEVLSNSKRFARSRSQQESLGYQVKDHKPYFLESADIYGLRPFFESVKVTNIATLSQFLTRVQHACRLSIHIYTGMRLSEVLSLMNGSLKREVLGRDMVYKLYAVTTKLVGQKKEASWITSKNILKAYRIANKLALLIGRHIGLSKHETPMFISNSYLEIFHSLKYDGVQIIVAKSSNRAQEVFNLFDRTQFVITPQDSEHLNKVDPFRSWHDEQGTRVGEEWRFTTHQFRRSMAFYCAQSSNVSIPTLKSQLKHISREMSLYYGQGAILADEFDFKEHMSNLYRNTKSEADAFAYLNQVLMSKESLFGTHGKFVARTNGSLGRKFFKSKRAELVERFKKGEIAYKETSIGACTTVTPCDKRLFRSIAACISCDRAVIKPSKLKRVIAKQKLFVKDLAEMDDYSVEYRTELAELEALENFKSKVVDKTD